ncbi:MAG: tetratricopeptide repeat protein, partial [Candidatus Promineifilaceae bacterium]
LLAYLSKRQLLLIIDNFEHILEAAPLVSEILTAAPQCKILATSREPLRLYGENLLQIAPLPLPDLRQQIAYEDLRLYAAVQLFTNRAQAVTSDFSLTSENIQQVAELCVQLDGLPLAIELAAGQSYAFTLAELTAQLGDRLAFLSDGPRDRSARQRTMRGAIDWSYSLLSEAEQTAFNRLSIFVGRFSKEAAAEIVGPVNLQRIVQKSLLQREEGADGRPRFWMLQIIRDYAYENLQKDQTFTTLKQKHTAFYLKLAKSAELNLVGPNQKDWFAALEAEHNNFRAVLARSLEEDNPQPALELGGILWRLWAVHSYLSEGTLWLEAILNKTASFQNESKAKLLFGAGRLAFFQQKIELASQRFNASLALYKNSQDQSAQANILTSLGEIAIYEDDYDQANQLFQEALELYLAEGDKAGITQIFTHLGQLAFNQQQFEEANDFLLKSLELGEEAGTPETIAIVLNGLGEIARMQGRNNEAENYYERSLGLYRQLSYSVGQAVMLHNLGQVKVAQEQFQEAATLFRHSLSLLKTMEEKIFIGWNLAGLGAALLNLDNAKHAVRLFSASEALFERFGGQLDALDQTVYDHYMAKSKEELSELEWKQAWSEGQTMPVENELLNVIALTPMLPNTDPAQYN